MPISELTRTSPVPIVEKTGRKQSLKGAIDALGVEHTETWAWANYERVVRDLTKTFGAKKLIEIGGGRDPLFGREDLAGMGAELTVNDISPIELAELPQGYRTACFDIANDLSDAEIERSGYDLAFSRMVFEHVADGERAWTNMHQILSPGGIGLAFVPTLYALPFVINWLLPDKFAARIVKMLYPNRTDEGDPVFPARYSWTIASEKTMRPMLEAAGFREVMIIPFYGHEYYRPFPIIRNLHDWFTKIARARDWRFFASYAYIAARK